ncbi:YadA-like family protein [Gallibacterium melopsittaci]|uniref:YadA-like family protein n=1 Tax=Gallibacterium melopsittaci TaxID=516063 RepID=A0ABV6HUA7_9PAST
MNHIFKVIFDKTRGIFVAVSELTKNHTKEKSEQIAEHSLSSPKRLRGGVFSLTSASAVVLIGLGLIVPVQNAMAWNDYGIYEKNYGAIKKAGAADQVDCSDNYTVNLTGSYASKIAGKDYDDTACLKGEGTVAIGFVGAWQINGGSNSVLIGRAFANGDTDKGNAIERSVLIGYNSGIYNWTGSDAGGATLVGSQSKAMGDQAVVVGNTSGAASQSVAIGGNVYARGESSIAIGNDDLIGSTDFVTSPFADKLPDATLKSIFGDLYNADPNANNKTGWFFKGEAGFNDKYNKTVTLDDKGTKEDTTDDLIKDYRIFSPTYAAKQGAIAIGSRTIAGGVVSTAVGSLSFALADRSTAMGIRAFVSGPGLINGVQDDGAVGATAIGENSRVFAKNSVAIGNSAEASHDGSFSYGYNAKAVGKGAVAFGYGTVAGARVKNSEYYALKQATAGLHALDIINSDGTTNATNVTKFNIGVDDLINGESAKDKNGTPQKENGTIKRISEGIEQKFTDNKLFDQKGRDGKDPANGNEFLEIGGKKIYNLQLGDSEKQSTIDYGAANGVAIGRYSFALRANSISMGYATISDAKSGIAIGSFSHVDDISANSVALGVNAYASGENAFVAGYSARTYANDSVVIGVGAKAGGVVASTTNSGEVGTIETNLRAQGYTIISEAESKAANFQPNGPTVVKNSITENGTTTTSYRYLARNAAAFGKLATATAFNAMAVGNNSVADIHNSVALGVNSKTDYKPEDLNKPGWVADGAVAIPTSAATGVISVGAINQERRIVNVASGANDSDAVNVAQLKTLGERISNIIGSENSSGLFQYMSIDTQNTQGKAGQLAAVVNKESNYNEYITLRKQYLGFVARQKLNGETINTAALDDIKARMDKLSDKTDFATRSAGLKDVQDKLDTITQNGVNKTEYDAIVKQLTSGFDADKKVDILSTEEKALKAKIEDSNFKNDGAQGADSIALGYRAKTKTTVDANNKGGQNSIAIGFQAGRGAQGTASNDGITGSDAIAIGTETEVRNGGGIAIGYQAKSQGTNTIVIGADSKVELADEQNNGLSTIVGQGNTIKANKAGTFGNVNIISAMQSYAVGNSNTIQNNATSSFIMGNNNIIGKGETESFVIGLRNTLAGADAITNGSKSTAASGKSTGSIVIGRDNTVNYTQGTDKGWSVILGHNINADLGMSVYLGDSSQRITGDRSRALGNSYNSVTVSSTTFSNFAGDNPSSIVTIGGATFNRLLQGVAAGTISATSTDAINGSQLFSITSGLLTKINGVQDNVNNLGNTYVKIDGSNLPEKVAVPAETKDDSTVTNQADIDAANAQNAIWNTWRTKLGIGDASVNWVNVNSAEPADKAGTNYDKEHSGALGTDSIAVGRNATAGVAANPNGATQAEKDGEIRAIAIGTDAKANKKSSIAVGDTVKADSQNMVVIGQDIQATTTDAEGAVVIGRQAGTSLENLDAKQTGTVGRSAVVIGNQAYGSARGSVALGANAGATAEYASALGPGSVASGVRALALQAGQASGYNAIAVGVTAKAAMGDSVAIGRNSGVTDAAAWSSVAIGLGAQANSLAHTGSFSIGGETVAANPTGKSFDKATIQPLVEEFDRIFAEYTTKSDQWKKLKDAKGLRDPEVQLLTEQLRTLGQQKIEAEQALNAKLNQNIAVFSVGAAGKERQIQNVAAGVISATSTDAINGSQLYYTNKYLTDLAEKVGNGPINGVDGATGAAGESVAGTPGTAGSRGQQGVPGKDGDDGQNGTPGLQGPAGRDGQSGTTLANKVQSLRDGVSGTVVYTDTAGNRVLAENGKYYNAGAAELANKVKANDGLWYDATDVNPDGSVKEQAKIEKKGKSLAQLVTAEADILASDKVILSAVNPDGKTATPVTLANIASALGIIDTTAPITLENAKVKVGTAGTNPTGLFAMKGAELNRAATAADLQALAVAGMNFTDRVGGSVNIPLGGALNIWGDGLTGTGGKATDKYVTTTAANGGVTIALTKAVTDKLDNMPEDTTAAINAVTLNFTGDNTVKDTSQKGAVKLAEQALAITGTENQIETTASGQGLSIKLAKAITDKLANIPSENVNELLNGKANIALDNIDADGKSVITGLVDVVESTAKPSDALEITSETDTNGKKTFTVALDDAKLKEITGTTNLATEYAKAAQTIKLNATTGSTDAQTLAQESGIEFGVKGDGKTIETSIDATDKKTVKINVKSGGIGSEQLGTNAVITDKIADQNVTKAKLQKDVQTSLENADALAKNTFKLTGDKAAGSETASATDTQTLLKSDGLSFAITGNDDITTNASGSSVALTLNKDTKVTEKGTKAVTSSAVYTAINAARPTIQAATATSSTGQKWAFTKDADNLIQVVKSTDGTGINGDTWGIALTKKMLTDALRGTYLESSTGGSITFTDDYHTSVEAQRTATINGVKYDVYKKGDGIYYAQYNADTETVTVYRKGQTSGTLDQVASQDNLDTADVAKNWMTNSGYIAEMTEVKGESKPVSKTVALGQELRFVGDGYVTVEYDKDENNQPTSLRIKTTQAVEDALKALSEGNFSGTAISYKANATGGKTVTAAVGFDFRGETTASPNNNNIQISLGAQEGVVDFTLDPNLRKITSIGSGSRDATDDTAGSKDVAQEARLTFNSAKGDAAASIVANDVKLTGLADGEIKAGSKDAVTGGQLSEALGINNNQHNSIGDRITKLEQGLKGTVVYTDKEGHRVVKAGDNFYKYDDVKDLYYDKVTKAWYGAWNKDENAPVGDKKTVAAISDPENIYLSLVDKNDGDKNTLTTPIALGNLLSGLGIETGGTSANGSTLGGVPITKDAAQAVIGKAKTSTEEATGLYAKQGRDLNRAATLADLQALGMAGLDILGNQEDGEQNANRIHKALGAVLNIEGKKDAKYKSDTSKLYSDENLITHNDKGTLRIEMLKNPSFTGVTLDNGKEAPANAKVTLTPTKSTADGVADKGKTVLNLTNGTEEDAKNPTANDVVVRGIAAGETGDSAVNKAQLDDLAAKVGAGTKPINGIDGAAGKDGASIIGDRGVPGTNGEKGSNGLQGPAGRDGLNGTTTANKVQALRDGAAGTVVYTKADTGERVLVENGQYYTIDTVKDKVKANDGLWYAKDDVDEKTGEAKAGKTGQTLADLAGNDSNKHLSADKVMLSAVNPNGTTNTATVLDNIKGTVAATPEKIADDAAKDKAVADYNASQTDDKQKVSDYAALKIKLGKEVAEGRMATAKAELEAQAKVEAARKAVAGNDKDGNGGLLTRTTGLNNAATVGDLQTVAQAGLTFIGNDDVEIHRPLGTALKIIGKVGAKYGATGYEAEKYSADNLITHNSEDGTLSIEMKKLPHFEGIVINGKDGDDGKDGFIGVDKDGNIVVNKNGVDGKDGLNGTDGESVTRVVTEENLKGSDAIVKLKYQTSNGTGYKAQLEDKELTKSAEVALDTGLDFKNGTNTTAQIDAGGIVKYNLNPELNGITSIGGGATNGAANEARITFNNGTQDNPDTKDIDESTTPTISVNHARLTDVANGVNANDAVNKAQLDDLAAKVGAGTKPINGIDGAAGKDGVDGKTIIGDRGVPGRDGEPGVGGEAGQPGTGLQGPAGRDGLNGTTTANKVQALRDGAAGTVVYTKADTGERVLVESGKYYTIDTVDGKVKANDGLWYAKEDVDAATGEAKEGKTGTTLAALAKAGNGEVVKPENVMLSAVNPEGKTQTPTTLANIKGNLGDKGLVTDEAAKKAAVEAYNADKAEPEKATDYNDLIAKLKDAEVDGDDNAKEAAATAKAEQLVAKAKADLIKAARDAVAGDSGLLTRTTGLNNAATVGDLQTVAQAGLTFIGNDGAEIHRPLGTALNIIGKSGVTYTTDTKPTEPEAGKAYAEDYTADNLITHNSADGTLSIEMKKTPTFDGIVLDGKNKDGKDGKDGYIGVDDKGNVVVKNGTNGTKGADGKDGADGASKVITEKDLNGTKDDGSDAAIKLAYKAGTEAAKETSLKQGLTFKGDDNIKTSTEEGGIVNVKLSDKLTGITSIGGATDENGKYTDGSLTFGNRNKEGGEEGEKEKTIDAGGSVITNIGTPTEDSDAANKGYVDDKVKGVDTKVTNLGDTVTNIQKDVNAGFTLNTGTQEVENGKVVVKETGNVGAVKPNTTVVMVDGKNTKVSKVDSGSANVISYTIEVNGIPMSYVNSAGDTLVKVGDKFVALKPNGEIDPTNTNTTIAGMKVVNPDNPDKGLTVDNVADGKVAAGSKQAVNGGQLHTTAQSVADVLGSDFENKDGKVTVKNGTDGTNGIGGTGKTTISEAFKEVVKRANIEVTNLDSNIKVEKDTSVSDKTIYKVGLSKDIKVENSITIGEGNVKLTSTTGEDAEGNSVPVLNVNKARITGVAAGVEDTDVANVGQVKALAAGTTKAINQVNKRVDDLTKESRGGIAGAMATAGLVQTTQPGRTTVSVGTATFKGESAVALGFSKLSDNGKVGIRISGMTTSGGDTGGSVSVGYTW